MAITQNDLRQPDAWQHFKKTLRRYARDLTQRVKRVDIQALTATWEVVGVDLSYWQGAVDFAKLATMVDFAVLRAGYGNDYIDPRLEEYCLGCKEYGIPFGLYWYAKPDKSWDKHGLSFYTAWAGNGGNLPPVFDLEETGGLTKQNLEGWWVKMYNRFNSLAGYSYLDDMTYTSPGFLNGAIALTSWLKHTVLWVAHWTTADQPILPNEWAVPGKPWTIWQWSATGKGSDYGVSSRYVDLNRYNGTRAEFEAEFSVTSTPPPPPEPGDTIVPIGNFTVKSTYRNLRAGPNTDAAVIGNAKLGSVLPYVEEDGEWKRVEAWVWKAANE